MVMKALSGKGGGQTLFSDTVSGSTSTGGNLITTIPTSRIILGAVCTNVNGVAIAPYNLSGAWVFRIQDCSQTGYAVKASTAVTIKYYYIED